MTDDLVRSDSERFAFLDWLASRTAVQHAKVPLRAVSSDVHIHDNNITIYVRDLCGNVIATGEGATARQAIDDCITKIQSVAGEVNHDAE